MLASSLVLSLGRLRRRRRRGCGATPVTAAASGRSRRWRSHAGWLALVVALSPPLDEWSEQWLAAHMVQHELLMVVAAPLIAVGAPLVAIALGVACAASRTRSSVRSSARRCPIVWRTTDGAGRRRSCSTALALWIWHIPALYDDALEHEAVHVVQHLCFFGTAALFWWGIAHGRQGRAGLRRGGRLRVRHRRSRRRAGRAAHGLAARVVRAVPRAPSGRPHAARGSTARRSADVGARGPGVRGRRALPVRRVAATVRPAVRVSSRPPLVRPTGIR